MIIFVYSLISFLILLVLVKSFFFVNILFCIDFYNSSLCVVLFFLLIFLFKIDFLFVSHWHTFFFFFFFFFSILSILFSFISTDSFFFILCFEIGVLPVSVVLNMFSKGYDKIFSTFFMVSFNLFGSLPFMMSLYYIYREIFRFYITFIYYNSFNSFSRFLIFFIINLSFLIKLPLIFFHYWLTKAHVRGFGFCSMILAGLMLKLGVVGLINFCFMFDYSSLDLFFTFFLISFLFFFPLLIITCFDFKMLIALSSVFHIGFVPFMIFSMSDFGRVGVVFILVSHGFVSSVLFFLLSYFYEFSFNRSIEFIKSLSILGPSFIFTFLFITFINFGLPPFMGFLGEIIFIYIVFNYSFTILFITLFSMFLLGFVILLVFVKFLLGKKSYFMGRFFCLSPIFYSFLCFYICLFCIFFL